MTGCRRFAVLTVLCLLLAGNTGCLSLSLFNRDMPDAKTRLDALERRVSALEANNPHGPPAVVVPGSPVPDSPPVMLQNGSRSGPANR